MKSYIFKPTATMKPYNEKHWWIEPHIIPEIRVEADSVKNAVTEFARVAREKYYVDISKNAIRNASPMYVDTATNGTIQTGYVITGMFEFQKDDYSWTFSKQYIDIWVEILETRHPDFPEV